jgi:hypothetical protein
LVGAALAQVEAAAVVDWGAWRPLSRCELVAAWYRGEPSDKFGLMAMAVAEQTSEDVRLVANCLRTIKTKIEDNGGKVSATMEEEARGAGAVGINRAHRLNSPWPVNVWSVICDGSIDRKLEAGIHEKKDAAELVLDGHLLGETPAEVNLAELLHIAEREFKTVKTLDEHELEHGWPACAPRWAKPSSSGMVNWPKVGWWGERPREPSALRTSQRSSPLASTLLAPQWQRR